MMSKILKLLVFFVPLIGLLVITNLLVDVGNITHESINDQVALSLISGNKTYISTGNMNERAVKRAVLERITQAPECIALGPSLVMCVDSGMVGSDSFLNCGVSGGNNYDVLGILEVLIERGLLPERIVICVDTMFFDVTRSTVTDTRGKIEWEKEYNRILTYFNLSSTSNSQEMPSKIRSFDFSKTKIGSAFSISSFQACIDFLSSNPQNSLDARIGVVSEGFQGAYWNPDGSHEYEISFQKQTEQDVVEAIQQYLNSSLGGQISANCSLDSERVAEFESMVSFLENNNVSVDLLLIPYPESIWEEIQQNEIWSLPRELDKYIHAFASNNNIRIIGSYNPQEVGVSNADFYDARHLRKESIAKYLDLFPEANEL